MQFAFLDLVHRYGDRVVALNTGKPVFEGLPKEIDDKKFKDIYGRDAERVGEETMSDQKTIIRKRFFMEIFEVRTGHSGWLAHLCVRVPDHQSRSGDLRSERRQESLVRVMRALAKPDILAYDQREEVINSPLYVTCPAGGAPVFENRIRPVLTL